MFYKRFVFAKKPEDLTKTELELVNSFKKLTNGTFSLIEPSQNHKDVVIATVMPTRAEPSQVQQQQQQPHLAEIPENAVFLWPDGREFVFA